MDTNKDLLKPSESSGEIEAPAVESVARTRRRLFRQGASVVAVTLASRPVLAWQCQSPSAWGSEQINPNTSLKTNDGHKKYFDEGWYIADWANNTNNNLRPGNPWDILFKNYPGLLDSQTSSTTTTKKKGKTTSTTYFDFKKVTVSKLVETVPGIVAPNGVQPSALAKDVMQTGTSFQKATLAAQLNFVLTSPWSTGGYDVENCVTLPKLNSMAGGAYDPIAGVSWGQSEIQQYLYNNWIVR